MGTCVVVIDDEPDHRRLLQTLLHGLGLAVHTAADGPGGVQAIRRLSPGLVITDLGLPGFGGAELIRRARSVTSAPIMIVSASSDILEVEASLAAGADVYLPKPFRPRTLRAYAQALLGLNGEPFPDPAGVRGAGVRRIPGPGYPLLPGEQAGSQIRALSRPSGG